MVGKMASSAQFGKWLGLDGRTGECEMGAKIHQNLSQCIRTDPGRSNFWDFLNSSEKGVFHKQNILNKEISRCEKMDNKGTLQEFLMLEKWNFDGRPEKTQNLACRPSDSGTERLLTSENVNVQEKLREPGDENIRTCVSCRA